MRGDQKLSQVSITGSPSVMKLGTGNCLFTCKGQVYNLGEARLKMRINGQDQKASGAIWISYHALQLPSLIPQVAGDKEFLSLLGGKYDLQL